MNDNSSAPVVKTTTVDFKPFVPPIHQTRLIRFLNYMKTPESAYWPMGFTLLGAHIFVGMYLLSDNFLDDFEDDDDAPTLVKKMVSLNISSQQKFAQIRAMFSGSKG